MWFFFLLFQPKSAAACGYWLLFIVIGKIKNCNPNKTIDSFFDLYKLSTYVFQCISIISAQADQKWSILGVVVRHYTTVNKYGRICYMQLKRSSKFKLIYKTYMQPSSPDKLMIVHQSFVNNSWLNFVHSIFIPDMFKVALYFIWVCFGDDEWSLCNIK